MFETKAVRGTGVSRKSRTGLALTLLGFLSACGGGGGSSSTFAVQSVSVPNNAVWPINRPIEIVFSEPIDFSTVSLSTISIRTLDGVPAVGSFEQDPDDMRIVRFVPRCPTRDDFLDAGLTPSPNTQSRIEYKISVVAASGSAPSVRSISGGVVGQGQPRDFITPLIDEPLDTLFLDTVPGPPAPIVRSAGMTTPERATRIEISTEPKTELFFEDGVLPGGVNVPLNLYSNSDTQLSVFVEFDQPISPRSENITSQRIDLQYDADLDPSSEDWVSIGTDVSLVANCVDSGATVLLRPVGILPQGRTLRVRVSPQFQDLVGEVNPSNVASFAFMDTQVPDNSPLPNPDESGDEVFESFVSSAEVVGSREDDEATFEEPAPLATWGDDRLTAGFDFEGTGGPGGNFDLYLPAGQTIIFNTTSSVFVGGPGGAQVTQQVAVNGLLDVRDLVIPEASTLLIQGPNPARILATGNVIVNGTLTARGSSNSGVVTLNTANVPEAGSAGQAGGGRGGKGSFLTTQSTPRGEQGFGAFNTPGGGGEGGESGFSQTAQSTSRRPGGGGGGTFGPDIADNTFVTPCPDNNIVGLDAEPGFRGSNAARGALSNVIPPAGGAVGPRPFFDDDDTNDFFGTMILDAGGVVRGELMQPWAGAGGGGGGDAVTGTSFPNPNFNANTDEKGSGGGGGGGSLRIQALGNVVIGPRGLINVNGGHGGGGENTSSLDRIGGGAGGGSGGHLIIETVQQIDLSQVLGTLPHTGQNDANGLPILDVGLIAAGGQGGAGASNAGGAGTSTSRQFPCRDATPLDAANCPAIGVNQIVCAGGDGGPGLIQLHVLNLDSGGPTGDIIEPISGTLFEVGPLANFNCASNFNAPKNNGVIKPPPVGSPWRSTTTSSSTEGWDQLLPAFGPVTRARSTWIPLGEASAQDGTTTPGALTFFFEGTDAMGFVEKTGTTVTELPLILDGNVSAVENGFRTAVLPAATLTDDVYQRNASLLRGYDLRVLPGGTPLEFRVASATYDSVADAFRVTVEGTGDPLAGLEFLPFELRPRFFRLSTGGVDDFLPDSATVQIEFQATEATLTGEPNETVGVPSAWETDITALNGNPAWRFVRFRVRFDIDAMGTVTLDVQTPRPSLDFLKLPFRF